jgi:hypothetical protein
MLAAAHLLFGVSVRGSIPVGRGESHYLFTTLSFGILISTVAKTQQAMQMTFFSFRPRSCSRDYVPHRQHAGGYPTDMLCHTVDTPFADRADHLKG